jgi:Legume lectin domain
MTWKMIAVLALLFAASSTQAIQTNVYITQNGATNGNGSSCTDSYSASWFSNSANWGTGSAQIGPGTTVHLCGAFTPAAGVQPLVARGSGTSTNPITIHFENGATITSPYLAGGGEIRLEGLSWIILDGNRANGSYIGATDNGSASAGYHNQQTGMCVDAGATTNVTIENLVCQNVYVHTDPTDITIGASQVAAVGYGGAAATTNLTINNCHFTQLGWAITVGVASGEVVEFTEFDHVDHGIADGGNSPDAVNISIHDNHFHDFANWDTNVDHYHHDGVHLWGVDTSGKGYHSGINIYNNLFDGDSGAHMTSWIYLENDIQNSNVFNNVVIPSTTNTPANGWILFGGRSTDTIKSQNNAAYNNTIIGVVNTVIQNTCYDVTYETSFKFENNVGLGCEVLFSEGAGVTLSTFDYNTWENMSSDHGDTKTFAINNVFYTTLSAWQSACKCDAHAQSASSSAINLDSTGHPQPGSVVIGFGTNLTSLGITALDSDKAGVARPSTSNWDDGAYQASGSTTLIDFASGFSSSGMQFNGTAVLNGTRLQLTSNTNLEAGSAFWTTLVNIQSFTNDFTFQLTNATADGFTFTIQNLGTTALGSDEGSLGYGFMHGQSVAVKFDLYNNAGEGNNSTGLYTNGAAPTVPATTIGGGVDLHSGDTMHVHMTYDGTTLSMTITDTVTNATFSTSWPINIPSVIGGSTAYAGFTGATGGASATQEIITWTYSH